MDETVPRIDTTDFTKVYTRSELQTIYGLHAWHWDETGGRADMGCAYLPGMLLHFEGTEDALRLTGTWCPHYKAK